jgi:hypothetical protein
LVIWEIKFKRWQLKAMDKEEMVTVIKEVTAWMAVQQRGEGREE